MTKPHPPSTVTEMGYIVSNEGGLIKSGAIWVNLEQALRAHRFGWRIFEARAHSDGKSYFAVARHWR